MENQTVEGTRDRIGASSLVRTLGVLFVMLVVAYLAYGLFFVPSLYSDDWGQDMEHLIAGNAKWVDLAHLRPLLFVPFLIQYHLFGVNVTANYVILWLLYIVAAFLIWKIVGAFPSLRSNGFAFVTALFFLIYPTNYAHMWLNMAHHYSGMVLAILSAYLLLKFAHGGKTSYLLLSFVSLGLSLGLYDGQLGVAAAWPAFLFLAYRKESPLRRRLALFVPIVLLGGLSTLRALTYQQPDDFYSASSISLDPWNLLSRLTLGYKISLAWGWTETLRYYIPWLEGSKSAVLFLGAAVTVPVLAAGYLVRDPIHTPNAPLKTAHLWPAIRPYVAAGLVGLALIAAGYIPTVTVFQPNLSEIASRFNLFASIGASLFLASGLMVFSILVCRKRSGLRQVFLVSAVPFLLLGVMTQASVQYRNRIVWEEQRTLWQTLFRKAPDIRDDTLVLLVLPGLQERMAYHSWWRTPLNASWDASAALRMFYDNPSLSADVLFPDADRFNEPSLTTAGVVNWQTRKARPYERTVAFVFDAESRQLTPLESLPAHWVPGATDPVKLGTDCILPTPVSNIPLRTVLLGD
ncbi:MAG: hypothetical protein EHM23_05415 [Acidobacteria bacterium]|nr:MAG: hypothetical protein EHM23_05415 [Acidobacteriota bacterium]